MRISDAHPPFPVKCISQSGGFGGSLKGDVCASTNFDAVDEVSGVVLFVFVGLGYV